MSTAIAQPEHVPAVEVAACPHCGTAVEGGHDRYCCSGCELAAQIISGAGLQQYYIDRQAFAPRPDGRHFDTAGLPVQRLNDGSCEVLFGVDGLRCASCTWVTERVLERTPGVASAHVSYATGRAIVRFRPESTNVDAIVGRVARLGYRPRLPEQIESQDRDLLVRTGLAAFVAGNVMLLSGSIYAGWWEGIAVEYAQLLRWTQLILTTPAVVYAAAPFFKGAWFGLQSRMLHMDHPIALAIGLLFVHGVAATWWREDAYLDSLTMLIALLLMGRMLEARGRKRAGEAASALAAGLPSRARRRVGAGLEEVSVDDLAVGDLVEVGHGEEFPADGRIADGTARVQMALITGESAPVALREGDRVVAGALVEEGAVTLRVEALGVDTVGARMARELRAATDRPVAVSTADRLAPWFVGLTLAIASVSFGVWTLMAGASTGLQVAVAVLVTACPCALGLSGPLAKAAGLGAAARRGVVMRDGDVLLSMADVDEVVLDKTGTVTHGSPTVVFADDEVLRIAAGLERHSSHPIARSIVVEATRRHIPIPVGMEVAERAGHGVAGAIEGRRFLIRAGEPGSVEVVEVDDDGQREQRIGVIRIEDRRREDASAAVDALRAQGVNVTLLTGDREEIARRIADEAHVPSVLAAQDPEGKASWIRAVRETGRKVLFVGDGLNDGPALVAADVGLSMSTGAASTLLVADGVVAHEALGPIPAVLRVARASRRAVANNVRRSVLYNVLAVTAAAFGLINPLIAAILMPLSSAWVIAGALSIERTVRRGER